MEKNMKLAPFNSQKDYEPFMPKNDQLIANLKLKNSLARGTGTSWKFGNEQIHATR